MSSVDEKTDADAGPRAEVEEGLLLRLQKMQEENEMEVEEDALQTAGGGVAEDTGDNDDGEGEEVNWRLCCTP